MGIKIESPKLALSKKLKTKQATIGVIGLGYVGLPLALEIVNKGYRVIGIDKSYEKIVTLKNGESYIADIPNAIIQEAMKERQLETTTDFSMLAYVDVIIICVPTPTAADGTPNISYIEDAVKEAAQNMSADTLIILESTTYPGTTEEVVQPILEQGNYVIGQDIFLTYSPERVDPGNSNFTVSNTPKVVGGVTEACLEIAKLFYETAINTNVFTVSNPKVAEMEKLLENTFRQINIALVNELSKICYKMNVDVWEVIEAASTKPYGFMPFTPGPGVGGHCIPVDPKYLLWAGEQYGVTASLIKTADDINDSMPSFVVERLENYLIAQQKELSGGKIVVIGVTYKPNINDFRESPALHVIRELQEKQYEVMVVDPYIENFSVNHCAINTVSLSKQLIREADAVLILTNHSEIDYEIIDQNAALIFDTRSTHFLFENKNYYKL